MVYQLGTRLGGRSEVADTPMVDLLGYLIADFDRKDEEANQEAQRLYLNHMSRMLARPQSKDAEKANKKFMKQISPDNRNSKADKGHNSVADKRPDVIGTDNWDSLDKLKAIENS